MTAKNIGAGDIVSIIFIYSRFSVSIHHLINIKKLLKYTANRELYIRTFIR